MYFINTDVLRYSYIGQEDVLKYLYIGQADVLKYLYIGQEGVLKYLYIGQEDVLKYLYMGYKFIVTQMYNINNKTNIFIFRLHRRALYWTRIGYICLYIQLYYSNLIHTYV